MRRTKIVCTIGPATESEKAIRGLIQSGMDVARLNFSHGSYAFHAKIIRTIRRIAQRLDKPVALLQDLPGPKIRVGAIEGNRAALPTGRQFTLTNRKTLGNNRIVSVSYRDFPRFVKRGDPILLGDGEIELEVLKTGAREVLCKIAVGGVLGSHKGIHFPRGSLDLPSLTPQDRRDMAFGIAQGVDLVALSFVRDSSDILQARREMKKHGIEIPIIAKIEKHEALDHIDSILGAVDGIMVARGDLGLEIPPEKIPAVQKMIIRKANYLGKPVITATQMLRSMVQNPRATRAEVADIANAILDGTDALMLSEESASGAYPIQAVKTMAQVAAETEGILRPRAEFEGVQNSVPEAISHAAVSLARDLQVKAFLVPTTSGSTARLIARYRPTQPIIAISPISQTVQSLALVWGIYPFRIRAPQNTDALIKIAQRKALELGVVRKGDLVAITAGLPLHQPGTTNMITVKTVD
jgi:pyruvate kinase